MTDSSSPDSATTDAEHELNAQCAELLLWQPLPSGVLRARGEGATFVEALKVALANLSIQRHITVRAKSESRIEKINTQTTSYFDKTIEASSSMVISDYEIVCKASQSAVVTYDNRPLHARIAHIISAKEKAPVSLSGSKWLINSPALSHVPTLNEQYSPKLEVSAYRQEGDWFIKLNSHIIKLRQQEWRQLYHLPDNKKGSNSIVLVDESDRELPGTLKNHQEFRVKIHTNSKPDLYLTLIHINDLSDVTPIRINKSINNKPKILIPDNNGVFSTELETTDSSLEEFIAIISEKPISIPANYKLLDEWLSRIEGETSVAKRVLIQ